jgi:hypothetical protein
MAFLLPDHGESLESVGWLDPSPGATGRFSHLPSVGAAGKAWNAVRNFLPDMLKKPGRGVKKKVIIWNIKSHN